MAESEKTVKIGFPPWLTSKKRQKYHFRPGGNAKNEKNSVSAAAENQKQINSGFPPRRKLFSFNFNYFFTMMIKEMKRSNLQNMEHFQFAGHVIAMCEESAIEKIKAVLEPLKTAVAEEDKALNLPRKQEGTARNKRTAEYEARLKPGFAALEQLLKLEAGSLSFTGKTEGTGAKRHYELAVKGQTLPDGKPKTIWVGVNKDGSLFLYEKKSAKPGTTGTTEKPEYEIKPKTEA